MKTDSFKQFLRNARAPLGANAFVCILTQYSIIYCNNLLNCEEMKTYINHFGVMTTIEWLTNENA